MAKEKGPYWVDKKQFYQAICDHRKEQSKNPDVPIPDYIGQCIINIATGVMSRYNFNRYSYRDEMIQDAVLTIVKYYNTFNIEESNNPYGYFWLAAYRVGQRKINLEKEQQAIKAKTVQNMFVDDDILSSDELSEFNSYMSDYYDFDLDEYDEARFKKKKKKKPNQVGLVKSKTQRDQEKAEKESENNSGG